MKLKRFDRKDPCFPETFAAFLATRREGSRADIESDVSRIIELVRREGAEAVCQFTEQFDGLVLDPTTLGADQFDLPEIAAACPEEVRAAIDHACERISRYHEASRPADGRLDSQDGIELSWRWTPIDSVGVYVPGGRASYPSTVLMNVLAARAAGVPRIVMTSPTQDSGVSPAVAYAAVSAGVDEFYPIGGAQAVAALAFGAGPLAPVDKIVGPGNAFVAAAKRQVFGIVGIDSIAGPSELTVVAGDENDPEWVAADLLSQAEHDPLAQSVLITDSSGFADAVEGALGRLLGTLSSERVARASLSEFGAVVLCTRSETAAVVNEIAPEHVEVAVEAADDILAGIRHAGAVFVGPWASEALGDYLTGSNHVLPTYGSARFSSGLSTSEFMKRTSVQRVSQQGFLELADSTLALAESEGLPAHALSVRLRKGK